MPQEDRYEWFADENFWRDLYLFMFPDRAFAVAEEQVEKILQLAGIKSGAALDLCCGPGRHIIPLGKRGFQVTGVDRTSFLLEKAQIRAKEESLAIELVLSDMREFSRPQAFDLIINIFTSFGYFEDSNDDLRVLQVVYENLKYGGTFVMDMISKEWLAANYQSVIATKLENGALLVQQNEITDDWTLVKNKWFLLQGLDLRVFNFFDRIYSGQELKLLLSAAGFRNVRLYGDLDGNPYDVHVKRLIAVARK